MEVQEFYTITHNAFLEHEIHVYHIPKGTFLFKEKESIHEMFFLLDGKLTIEKKQQLIWIAEKN